MKVERTNNDTRKGHRLIQSFHQVAQPRLFLRFFSLNWKLTEVGMRAGELTFHEPKTFSLQFIILNLFLGLLAA